MLKTDEIVKMKNSYSKFIGDAFREKIVARIDYNLFFK